LILNNIFSLKELLYNPVYNALITRDSIFSHGTDTVKYFDEEQSPFVGFDYENRFGFDELYEILPPGRKILFAISTEITAPAHWRLIQHLAGLQFIYKGKPSADNTHDLVKLDESHTDEMIALARLTQPGPFAKKTIDFGHYYGIFSGGKLVSMTGQRLHPGNCSELSAVCTHPDHLGKGYAAALMNHQLNLILEHGEQPFLHVRNDNKRAIELYERLGFICSRPMNFYFMRRED